MPQAARLFAQKVTIVVLGILSLKEFLLSEEYKPQLLSNLNLGQDTPQVPKWSNSRSRRTVSLTHSHVCDRASRTLPPLAIVKLVGLQTGVFSTRQPYSGVKRDPKTKATAAKRSLDQHNAVHATRPAL